MPLAQEDYQKLSKMQELTDLAIQDTRKIEEFIEFLSEVEERQEELMELYSEDWMRIVDDESLDDEQNQALDALVPEGQYSVLDQDTIWNALEDLSDAQITLLKHLAEGL